MDKQMLILATTRDFLGKFEQENVKILQGMGYTVHFAANTGEQAELYSTDEIRSMKVELHHIDIERSPYMIRNNRKAFVQLIDLVKKYKISLVHCHTPVGGVLGRLLGRYFKKDGIKIIYTAHGFHFYKGAPLINNSIYYCAEKVFARYTDLLVVINGEDYRNAKKFRLRKGGKVYQIPGVGLDRDKFHPLSEEERRASRAKLGIAEGKFFMISVGEINGNKNHEIILEALEKMKNSGQDISDILYVICGEGFLKDVISRQIRDRGLQDHVWMLGSQKDIVTILGAADVFLFPSKREGLGMAALEALSMGIPVVASDNRGTREYMADGENGYICDPRKAESFIRGIRAVYDLGEKKLKRMKEKCRESTARFDKIHTNEIMSTVYILADKMIRGDAV